MLGPIDSNDVTGFYFDQGAQCSGATYAPDHVTLNRKLKKDWMPAGVDMKGFVHSHPPAIDRLSSGDIFYISRLLRKNPDMKQFAAPIIIPGEFRFCPFVVLRRSPTIPHDAKLVLM